MPMCKKENINKFKVWECAKKENTKQTFEIYRYAKGKRKYKHLKYVNVQKIYKHVAKAMTGSPDTTYYEMSSLRRQQARTWGQRRRKGICSPAPSPDLGTSSSDAGQTARMGQST